MTDLLQYHPNIYSYLIWDRTTVCTHTEWKEKVFLKGLWSTWKKNVDRGRAEVEDNDHSWSLPQLSFCQGEPDEQNGSLILVLEMLFLASLVLVILILGNNLICIIYTFIFPCLTDFQSFINQCFMQTVKSSEARIM